MAKQEFNSKCPKANKKLHDIRKELKLSQYNVADKLGLLYDTYSKKERSGNITFAFAIEFSNALGVDPYRFADVLKDDKYDIPEPENPFSSPKGTVLKANEPNSVIERFYGKNAEEPEEVTEPKAKKTVSYELDATEQCLMDTFRSFTKSKRNEAFDYLNNLRERKE